MFSLGQRCCSTTLEMRKHINVGCTKIESMLEVVFHLHCMGNDVEDMIHWLKISGRDEDVLENALSILTDLFSVGNNMVYEIFVFSQGRQKEMKSWPAFLPDHTNWHAYGVYWAGSFNQNVNRVSLLIIQALSKLSASQNSWLTDFWTLNEEWYW